MAEFWHCRPSSFFPGLPAVTAFQIDAAATLLIDRRPSAEEELVIDIGKDLWL